MINIEKIDACPCTILPPPFFVFHIPPPPPPPGEVIKIYSPLLKRGDWGPNYVKSLLLFNYILLILHNFLV